MVVLGGFEGLDLAEGGCGEAFVEGVEFEVLQRYDGVCGAVSCSGYPAVGALLDRIQCFVFVDISARTPGGCWKAEKWCWPIIISVVFCGLRPLSFRWSFILFFFCFSSCGGFLLDFLLLEQFLPCFLCFFSLLQGFICFFVCPSRTHFEFLWIYP